MPNTTALEKKIHKLLNNHGGKEYLTDTLYLSDDELNKAVTVQQKFALTIEKLINAKASEAQHKGLQLLTQPVPDSVARKKPNDYMDGIQYAYTVKANYPLKISEGNVMRVTRITLWVWYTCEPSINID